MNAKLIFKTIFALVILLLLVLMGMNNLSAIKFSLPPLVQSVSLPSALMYFGFFAVGVLTATVLTAGGGKSSGGSSSKPAKK
jgi:uncharacterized integral membrane protein